MFSWIRIREARFRSNLFERRYKNIKQKNKLRRFNVATKKKNKLKVIPLGGMEEIGKNMTVFEYGENIIIVDCGLAFPEDEMLGIDLVIPDITYLEKNIEKVHAILVTHGHEDHIGAIPYVLKRLNVPVYGTELTIGLIENKLAEHELNESADLRKVKAGQTIQLGPFKIEFVQIGRAHV